MTDLGRFPHYMIKEIFEQPQSLRATLDGRVCPQDGSVHMEEEIGLASKDIERLPRITIIASGTSRHAGMVGRYMIEELAKLPVDVEYASEFELCNLHPAELTIVITQSGETADTSGAQRKAKARGSRTSEDDQELSRLSDDTINIPRASELLAPILEIVPLQMIAYYMAVRRGSNVDRPRNLVKSVTGEI